MTELKNHKDKYQSEHETIKSGLNSAIKHVNYQIEASEKKNKELNKENLKKFEENLKEDNKLIPHRIDQVKIENGKYHLEAMNKVKEAKAEIESFTALKDELNEAWAQEIDQIKNLKALKYEEFFKELDKVKDEVTDLEETVNVSYNIYKNTPYK